MNKYTVYFSSNIAVPICEELKVDFCKELNYTSTYLPNYLNHTHQVKLSLLLT